MNVGLSVLPDSNAVVLCDDTDVPSLHAIAFLLAAPSAFVPFVALALVVAADAAGLVVLVN